MIVKKHYHSGRLILALCDDSLHNHRLEKGDVVLDLRSEFYNGTKMKKEELCGLLHKCYIVNAVGPDSVNLLIQEKLISEENPKHIGDIPYVMVVFESA